MMILNKDNGRIGISARSHYGKSWLAMSLMRQLIEKGYPIYALLYTKEPVFKDLYEKEHVFYAPRSVESFIKFIGEIKPNSVVFIDDLDLYLNTENKTEIMNIMKNFLSACRKANIILIYTIKEFIGLGFTSLASLTEILIIGKFSRYSVSYKNIGIDEEMYNSIDENKREFILKEGDFFDYIHVNKDGNIVNRDYKEDEESIDDLKEELDLKKKDLLHELNKLIEFNNKMLSLYPLFAKVKNKLKKPYSEFFDYGKSLSKSMKKAIENKDFDEMKRILNKVLENINEKTI